VWVTSAVSVPVSDRTLDVLIDHLRDLDLPTILARMADRSEPYCTHGRHDCILFPLSVLAVSVYILSFVIIC